MTDAAIQVELEVRLRRPADAGSIERVKAADGSIRFRARKMIDGVRRPLGVFDTEEAAQRRLDAAADLLADGEVGTVAGTTLRSFAEKWLDRRELSGKRNIITDRRRWATHVDTAPFANRPMAAITRHNVQDWVDALSKKKTGHRERGRKPKKLSPQTVRHCLNLLRVCLRAAVRDRLIEENPAEGVEAPALAKGEKGWTYLTPDEQRALIECPTIPEPDRLIIQFALATGVRQGEQWNLELADVHLEAERPWVHIKYGKPGHKPPKNGEPRPVELNGMALDALQRWMKLLPDYTKRKTRKGIKNYGNEHRLVFPTARGCRRGDGKPIRHWAEYLKAAGLVAAVRHDRRGVRWHDLRHSCASSLVAGWWGRKWPLIEVSKTLGHKSTKTTEMYAHLADSVRVPPIVITRIAPS